MIKNYVLFLVLILFNLNINAQSEASNANLTESFTHEFADNNTKPATLNGTTDFDWTFRDGETYWINTQVVQNGQNSTTGASTFSRLQVKRSLLRHQWNTPIVAEVGDIVTLKMTFKLQGGANGVTGDFAETSTDVNGTVVDNGNVFRLGFKTTLDTNYGQLNTQLQESFVINLDSDSKLNINYKTNLNTAVYQTDNWDTFTIKFFVGSTAAKSKMYAQLNNQGVKSGWINEVINVQELYDAITGVGAYMFFESGNALKNDGATEWLMIDKYEFWTDGLDTGLVLTAANSTFNGSSSTNAKPVNDGTSRVFIFGEIDAFFSGNYNRNWAYLFVDTGASFDFKPQLNGVDVPKIFTLQEGADILGTLQTTRPASNINFSGMNIGENGSADLTITEDLILTGSSNIEGSVSLSNATDSKIVLKGLSFGESGNFTLNNFTEGNVKVSSSQSFTTTNAFDDYFTYSTENLSVSQGGFLLRKSSYYCGYNTAPFWSGYDSTSDSWVIVSGDFPDSSTTDYSSSNLIYNSQAYGSGSIKNTYRNAVQFNNIHILDGKKMVINDVAVSANQITLEDDTDPEPIIMFNGTLKTSETLTANVKYLRYINEDRWYMISSPVTGQDIDEFIADEDLYESSNPEYAGYVGFAEYNNDASLYDNPSAQADTETGWWDYEQTGQNDTGKFTGGKGYIVKLKSDPESNQITFGGGVNNDDAIAISSSDLFTSGSTTWPYIYTATSVSDPDGGIAQTLSINVVSLPTAGANISVFRTLANGNDDFSFGTSALTLGTNTISVPATQTTFDRAVKFRFSNGEVEFDSITLNDVAVWDGAPASPSTSTTGTSDEFTNGPNSTWTKVITLTTAASGNSSRGAQTLTINITNLPSGGANYRVFKTTANGSSYFGGSQALTIGEKTITVAAAAFDRTVKIQFSSDNIEFDSLIVNGSAVFTGSTTTSPDGTVTVPITTNTTAFNLVGNPYLSAIAINTVADASNNVLTLNSAVLSEQTAWFWNGNSTDGAIPGYVTINQNPSQAAKISMPAQAFFIKSAAGGGSFSFTPAMQTSSYGSFNRQTEFSKIDLSMSADGQTSATEIVYFEGATTGW
ncbi:MAG: hypothetical protein CMC56_00225, partial [Flavobacteriaceae bacterium]|nr:hypothetical protein [Flavobacteriaceae bacterium]